MSMQATSEEKQEGGFILIEGSRGRGAKDSREKGKQKKDLINILILEPMNP